MMSTPQTAHMINLFRVLSLVSVPLCWNLPSVRDHSHTFLG